MPSPGPEQVVIAFAPWRTIEPAAISMPIREAICVCGSGSHTVRPSTLNATVTHVPTRSRARTVASAPDGAVSTHCPLPAGGVGTTPVAGAAPGRVQTVIPGLCRVCQFTPATVHAVVATLTVPDRYEPTMSRCASGARTARLLSPTRVALRITPRAIWLSTGIPSFTGRTPRR
jgi:hypothetical protein